MHISKLAFGANAGEVCNCDTYRTIHPRVCGANDATLLERHEVRRRCFKIKFKIQIALGGCDVSMSQQY